MKRVSSLLPTWDRSRADAPSNAKPRPALAALHGVFGGWGNANTDRKSAQPALHFGKETYWPTTIEKECEKAALILKSFCIDGFLAQEQKRETAPRSPATPSTPNLIQQNIPPRIIQNAVGLAIFSCMRSGLWMSGSGGSGVLIARKADGTWSPPSGILLHTANLAFVLGIDIYDCVLVINSVAALEMFTHTKVALGNDVDLTVGPLISKASPQLDIRWKELNNTVLTYLKAKGKHQNVRLDGSLVTERANENERFYGDSVNVLDILAGNVKHSVPETRPLFELIKAAEGRTDFDTIVMERLSHQPAPGDAIIDNPMTPPMSPLRSPFGVPSAEDPDPFGVIALEMAGLEIREAGTRSRPQSNQFEFHPSPTSPTFSKFSRQSIDTSISRSNRGSYTSSRTQMTAMTDACTQIDEVTLSSDACADAQEKGSAKLPTVMEPEEIDYTKIDFSSLRYLSRRPSADRMPTRDMSRAEQVELSAEKTTRNTAEEATIVPEDSRDEDADDEDEDEDDGEDEAPVVYEIATAAQPARTAIMSSQVTHVIQAKGSLVNIPKRVPPPLPTRSPARGSRISKEYGDVSPLRSPLRISVQSTDLHINAMLATDAPPAAAASADIAALVGLPESDTDEETRWSIASSGSRLPSTPQIGPSSAEESDRGPQTPKMGDEVFKSTGKTRHDEPTDITDHVDGFVANSGDAHAIAVV